MKMENSVESECRLCLAKCCSYLDIFSEQGKRLNIADILTKYLWFKVEENDEYQKIVCSTCWWKVENFHIFYQNIFNVHNNKILSKLSERISDDEIKTELFESIEKCIEMKMENNLQDNCEESFTIEKIHVLDNNVELQETYRDDFTDECLNKKLTDIETDDIRNDVNYSDDESHDKSEYSDDENEEGDEETLHKRKKKRKSSNSSVAPKKRNSEEAQAEDAKIREYFKMECDLCPTKFFRFPDVKVHYRDIHQLNGYVSCCSKKFFRRIRVLEHIMKHLNPEAFKCEICNKVYADKPGLLHHMDSHAPLEDKIFKCEKCPKQFAKKFQLDQHQIRHISDEDKRFFCDECGKAFATKSILQSHKRGVHENAYVHLCDICSKVFKSKMFFEKHRIEHNNMEPTKVQCQICGKYLKHDHSLRSHMARHADANSTHICKICGKIAPNKGALRSHTKFVHIIERKFKCSICEKAFKKSISLKEHMTLHTGEILYTCNHCPKTFNSSANLHSHKKKIHTKEWEESRRNKI